MPIYLRALLFLTAFGRPTSVLSGKGRGVSPKII